MKIILIGAKGTIGSAVQKAFENTGHEIIRVGKSSGDFQVDIASRESVKALYKKVGSFDAVANASGDVAFAPLGQLGDDQWKLSLSSKLMGQINLVQEAIPYINEGGSFALVTGILSSEFIRAGVAASTVNRAIEGFAQSAAIELPKKLRINVISPALLKESEKDYGDFFPGFVTVEGSKVGQAYKRAILGAETGKIYQVS